MAEPTKLNVSLYRCTELVALDFSHNDFTEINWEIGLLTKLTKLVVHHNRITRIDNEGIGKTKIRHLEVRCAWFLLTWVPGYL